MRQLIIILLLTLPAISNGQPGFKAGYNFCNISKAGNINADSRSGFHIGGFISPKARRLFSSRTEIIFSRQGYNFETSTTTGEVKLDYIMLPQLMGVNLTKFVQVQAGFQVAYLLNARADSTAQTIPAPATDKIIDMYNRFDYGFAAGVEIHPFKGLIISARANFNLGKLAKQNQAKPSYVPDINGKTNVIQLSAGWHFGK